MFRIYNPTSHGQSCCFFRRFGPVARFDHHRHPASSPSLDNDRGIYYAAPDFSCCIVEVFGDTGQIVCGDYHLALVRTIRDLRLLDLCGDGAMRAGTVAAIAKSDHDISRAWSRYFYDETAFQLTDGLQYFNAHNDELAYALYERAETALECIEEIRLDDPSLRSKLAFIARRTNLLLSS
jgi:hypothetical protein